MKRLGVVLTVIILDVFFLWACVATQTKKVGDHFVFEKEKIKYKEMGGNWKHVNPERIDREAKKWVFAAFQNKKKFDVVWIRQSIPKYTKSTEDLVEKSQKWVNGYVEYYSFKNHKMLSEGWSEIDGIKSYWREFSHKWVDGNTTVREKSYWVYIDTPMFYQFRLMADSATYPELVIELDEWIKTIKFIR